MPRPLRVLAFLLLATSSAAARGAASAGADAFPMPARLAPAVDFWARVYTEVGTHGGLIHDSENLSVVFEVVSVPPGSSEGTLERRVDQAKARARAALKKLASGRRQGLSAYESQVLAQFPPDVSNRTLAASAERVRFQRGQANKFQAGLERMGRWESHVRRALRERGVPEDLKALPHVESSYNPEAHSHAGAAGLWQFTRPTGRLYMRIDHIVDERRDPFVASEAAAKLLRENYERLGTWPLAITAYNHGPGGLAKAVRQFGTRDIGTIVARYSSPSFGFASKNFYAEFLAARRIDRDPERFFGPIRKQAPDDHESVVLRQSYGAQALARALRLSTAELRDWNPALMGPVWSGARNVPVAYELRVPRRGDHPPASQLVAGVPGGGFQGASASAAEPRPELSAGSTHRVRRGETLGEIARRYGTSTEAIAASNGIRNPRRIREGQVLEIPGIAGTAGTSAPSAPAEPPVPSPWPVAASEASPPAGGMPPPSAATVATVHRVARGETLGQIARRYEVSMAKIAGSNGIRDPRELREGQTLEIPVPDHESATAARPSDRAAEPENVARVEPVPSARPAVPTEPAPSARAEPAVPAEPAPSARPEAALLAEPAPSPRPEPAGLAEPAAPPAPDEPAPRRTHTIVAGDTLGSIARRNGTTAQALADANGIDDPRSLRPGRLLTLPGGAAPEQVAEAQTRVYVVRGGDTLYSIAARHGLRVADIARENGLLDGSKLSIGQRLRLPAGEGT